MTPNELIRRILKWGDQKDVDDLMFIRGQDLTELQLEKQLLDWFEGRFEEWDL